MKEILIVLAIVAAGIFVAMVVDMMDTNKSTSEISGVLFFEFHVT